MSHRSYSNDISGLRYVITGNLKGKNNIFFLFSARQKGCVGRIYRTKNYLCTINYGIENILLCERLTIITTIFVGTAKKNRA